MMFTYEPEAMTRFVSCLALTAEDLADNDEYQGHCLHYRQKISARAGSSGTGRSGNHVPTASGPGGRVAACIMREGGHGAGSPIFTEIIRPDTLRIAYNGAQIGLKCL